MVSYSFIVLGFWVTSTVPCKTLSTRMDLEIELTRLFDF